MLVSTERALHKGRPKLRVNKDRVRLKSWGRIDGRPGYRFERWPRIVRCEITRSSGGEEKRVLKIIINEAGIRRLIVEQAIGKTEYVPTGTGQVVREPYSRSPIAAVGRIEGTTTRSSKQQTRAREGGRYRCLGAETYVAILVAGVLRTSEAVIAEPEVYSQVPRSAITVRHEAVKLVASVSALVGRLGERSTG
jgi:hypothetical protein